MQADKEHSMLDRLEKWVKPYIGNTPIRPLNYPGVDLYAKLEYCNFSGSTKDRAAYNMIREAIAEGKIDQNSTVVASSSGNFAIACASILRLVGIEFVPVVDPNINPANLNLLRTLCNHIEMVDVRDNTGGYLLTRIARVDELCSGENAAYCLDQYNDPANFRGYMYTLGQEILDSFENLDYLFTGVSSGGTITGLSLRLKEAYPNLKTVAVDVEGSVIFGFPPAPRRVSGIGASQRSAHLNHALVDEVVMITEAELVQGCQDLLGQHAVFAGGSSGACYAAVQKVFGKQGVEGNPTALFICPDRGYAYLDNVYNPEWVKAGQKETQLA